MNTLRHVHSHRPSGGLGHGSHAAAAATTATPAGSQDGFVVVVPGEQESKVPASAGASCGVHRDMPRLIQQGESD